MNQSVSYRQNAAGCYEAARILTPVKRPNCLRWRSHGFGVTDETKWQRLGHPA